MAKWTPELERATRDKERFNISVTDWQRKMYGDNSRGPQKWQDLLQRLSKIEQEIEGYMTNAEWERW